MAKTTVSRIMVTFTLAFFVLSSLLGTTISVSHAFEPWLSTEGSVEETQTNTVVPDESSYSDLDSETTSEKELEKVHKSSGYTPWGAQENVEKHLSVVVITKKTSLYNIANNYGEYLGELEAGDYVFCHKYGRDITGDDWYRLSRNGQLVYFYNYRGTNLKVLPANTSKDSIIYRTVLSKAKAYHKIPLTSGYQAGSFAARAEISYKKWSADGKWLYASDGLGGLIFFTSTDLLSYPSKTSTDPYMYVGVTKTSRTIWSLPSGQSARKGTIPAGSLISYYKWTKDGTWVYAGDGMGNTIYFRGNNIELIPSKTSTDKTIYYATTTLGRSYWSAPTAKSVRMGGLPAGSRISYLKYTADGYWLYANDGTGKIIYFRSHNLKNISTKP